MRSFDTSPLMRATVGFDRMMKLLDAASQVDEGANGYPPYNIEKRGEDQYRITMAVAGFTEQDLEITAQENRLTITGNIGAGKAGNGETGNGDAGRSVENGGGRYLHRGIATRSFERRFELADHIRVSGAGIENGLLHVDLLREVPEAMKPRTIAIETVGGSKPKEIEQKAA